MPSPAANPQFQHFEQPAYPPLEPPAQQQQQHDEHMQMQMQMQMEQQQHDANALEIDGLKLEARDAVYWDTLEVEHRNAEMQQISQDLVVLQEVFKDAAQEVELQGEQLEVADTATEEAKVNTKSAVKVRDAAATHAYVAIADHLTHHRATTTATTTAAVARQVVQERQEGRATCGRRTGRRRDRRRHGRHRLWADRRTSRSRYRCRMRCCRWRRHGQGAAAQHRQDHAQGSPQRSMAARQGASRHRRRAPGSSHSLTIVANHHDNASQSVSNCTACNRKFTATFRKHHCRNCGFIFCQKVPFCKPHDTARARYPPTQPSVVGCVVCCMCSVPRRRSIFQASSPRAVRSCATSATTRSSTPRPTPPSALRRRAWPCRRPCRANRCLRCPPRAHPRHRSAPTRARR